jgi:hypothetical protein
MPAANGPLTGKVGHVLGVPNDQAIASRQFYADRRSRSGHRRREINHGKGTTKPNNSPS